MTQATDRIERKIVLEAPRSRVWRALSNAEEFGQWFGVKLTGKSFAAGKRVQGQITYPGYEHVVFDVQIERVEPERLISWRWHPAAVEKDVGYLHEPTTLVEFELTDAAPLDRVSHEQRRMGRADEKYRETCRCVLARRSRAPG